MITSRSGRAAPLLFLLLLSACGAGQATEPQGSSTDKSVVACEDPRPQMCTMDYRPVCGLREDGSEKTYSNGCAACSDPQVQSWRPGSCEQTDVDQQPQMLE